MRLLKQLLISSILLSSYVNASQQAILLIEVENVGIQRMNAQQIQTTGLDLIGLDAKDLALYVNDQLVPIYISNLNSGKITQNSAIEFIGKPEVNLYQKHTNYYLTLGNGKNINDLELESQNNLVSTINKQDIQAPNLIYNIGSNTNDPWHAKNILAIQDPVTEVLSFDVLNKNSLATTAELEIVLFGGTDYPQFIDHYVEISLNGQQLGTVAFDGLETQNLNYQIDSNLINNGTNEISVRVPNSTGAFADLIQVESWSIKYVSDLIFTENQWLIESSNSASATGIDELIFRSGFEVAQQTLVIQNAQSTNYSIYQSDMESHIQRINNYSLSDNCTSNSVLNCVLKVTTQDQKTIYIANDETVHTPTLNLPVINTDIIFDQAQYLIISHPDFINQDLYTYINYKSGDYQIQLVDVEQIYSQFGYYNKSANAIDEYIRFAANSMNTEFVMLVGADTYDYHNNLNIGSISFIPTLYAATDDLIKYAPVDAKFADINDDNIPDISLGRLPVRTEDDLRVMLNKIYLYDQKDYSQTALISADEFDNSQIYSFSADAESIIDTLPASWQSNITDDYRAFMDHDGLNLAQTKIIDRINNGVALTSFIGHTGTRAWSYSRLFRNSHASSLINADKPTLVTQWGCWNSYFVSPLEDTMAHAFMLNANGGAVASLGASTLTTADNERLLSQLVFKQLVNDQLPLGQAVLNAKRLLSRDHPEALDVILGWNILGDPTIKL
jgi:hypothetical protein